MGRGRLGGRGRGGGERKWTGRTQEQSRRHGKPTPANLISFSPGSTCLSELQRPTSTTTVFQEVESGGSLFFSTPLSHHVDAYSVPSRTTDQWWFGHLGGAVRCGLRCLLLPSQLAIPVEISILISVVFFPVAYKAPNLA